MDLFGIPKSTAHEVYIAGAAGHGSTATKIRVFLTVVRSRGTAITIIKSAIDGWSFRINESGLYAITYRDYRGGAGHSEALSINSTQLTTTWSSIPASSVIDATNIQAADSIGKCARTTYLNVGDILRAHTDGTPDGTGTDVVGFSVVKVA